jgi:hypothetical protein
LTDNVHPDPHFLKTPTKEMKGKMLPTVLLYDSKAWSGFRSGSRMAPQWFGSADLNPDVES